MGTIEVKCPKCRATEAIAEAEFALEESVTIRNFSDLQAAINEAPADGTECVIEITSDIYGFGAVIAIPSGKNITLISLTPAEPFVLTKNSAGRYFSVNSGGNVSMSGGIYAENNSKIYITESVFFFCGFAIKKRILTVLFAFKYFYNIITVHFMHFNV